MGFWKTVGAAALGFVAGGIALSGAKKSAEAAKGLWTKLSNKVPGK